MSTKSRAGLRVPPPGSPFLCYYATPEGPEGLEYGTDANASAAALSVRPVGEFDHGSAVEVSCLSEKYPGYGVLPGKGLAGPGCQEPRGMRCGNCGSKFWSYHSCMERQCPVCYERWAAKEGRRAARRVWAGSLALRSIGYESGSNRRGRVPHVVVALVDDGFSPDEYMAEAYLLAKRHGVLGGCAVFHPFRQDEFDAWVPDGNVHVHIVGYAPGDILPGGIDVDLKAAIFRYDALLLPKLKAKCQQWHWPAEKGRRARRRSWTTLVGSSCLELLYDSVDETRPVFKHIQDREYSDYRGIRSERAAKRLIQYLLTHTSVVETKHALRWFGALAYNKLPERRMGEFSKHPVRVCGEWVGPLYDESQSVECPVCGSADTDSCMTRVPQYTLSRRTGEEYCYDVADVRVYDDPSHRPDEKGEDELVWLALQRLFAEKIEDYPARARPLDYVYEQLPVDRVLLDRVIKANVRTKRLEFADADPADPRARSWHSWHGYAIIPLRPWAGPDAARTVLKMPVVLTLDAVLFEMRYLLSEGRTGIDWRLDRIVQAGLQDAVPSELLSDAGFVFGTCADRWETRGLRPWGD